MRHAHAKASASPSPVDGDGVRIVQFASPGRGRGSLRLFLVVVGGLVFALAIGGLPVGPSTARPGPRLPPLAAAPPQATDAVRYAPPDQGAVPALPTEAIARLTAAPAEGDPHDLASYFREGDDVPDTANLIRALNEAGITTGIAAFNPPGTSPPLEGIAVPDDFQLPPGYVRHHQATDEGEPLPPILMFAPDLVWRDAQGRVIALPENRVVPRDMAPPGLPVRWVRPGSP